MARKTRDRLSMGRLGLHNAAATAATNAANNANARNDEDEALDSATFQVPLGAMVRKTRDRLSVGTLVNRGSHGSRASRSSATIPTPEMPRGMMAESSRNRGSFLGLGDMQDESVLQGSAIVDSDDEEGHGNPMEGVELSNDDGHAAGPSSSATPETPPRYPRRSRPSDPAPAAHRQEPALKGDANMNIPTDAHHPIPGPGPAPAPAPAPAPTAGPFPP
ncbi:hypothetical protein BCR34DRAFT_39594 [Clohesyomyces aquaticus]|uniref:Uncharacterized protein n=1 Tax=Clohesyomyces aquaticus TaxID=1231657 RepID=A0A1Y2A4N4_9PLEO|nr:hypothetical protein BCR34DRAFT_39594 [Clohesyomyces aquaticus]